MKTEKTAEQYVHRLNKTEYIISFDLALKYFADKKVLDIGCGTGNYLAKFSAGSIGIDYSLPNLKECAKRGLNAIKADINSGLPFSDEAFDGVLMSHILEHVEAPVLLLREAYRVLANGGIVCIGLPVEKSLVRIILRDHYFKNHPTHLYSFSPDCLHQLFKITRFTFENLIVDIPMVKRLHLRWLLCMVQKLPAWLVFPFAGNFWFIGVKS